MFVPVELAADTGLDNCLTSSATRSGNRATEAPAAAATPASEVVTASSIDSISGATITSKAVVNGLNLCAEFIKSLLAGGNA